MKITLTDIATYHGPAPRPVRPPLFGLSTVPTAVTPSPLAQQIEANMRALDVTRNERGHVLLDLLAGIIGATLFFTACHALAVAIDLSLHRMGV